MNIGHMDRKLTIEQPTYTVSSDSNNKYVSAWTTYKKVWGAWVHKSSQEVFETGQMVAKDTYEFKIRYLDASAVKMDMRILYNSEYYYLIARKELGRREAWLLTTIKRDN